MLQVKISLIFNVYKTLTILYSLISWGKYMCLLIAVELFTIFIKITSQRYSSVSGLQLHKALRLILKCVVNTAVVICCEITLRLTLPGPNYFDINNHTTESLCSKFGFTSLWKIKCIVLWITRMKQSPFVNQRLNFNDILLQDLLQGDERSWHCRQDQTRQGKTQMGHTRNGKRFTIELFPSFFNFQMSI